VRVRRAWDDCIWLAGATHMSQFQPSLFRPLRRFSASVRRSWMELILCLMATRVSSAALFVPRIFMARNRCWSTVGEATSRMAAISWSVQPRLVSRTTCRIRGVRSATLCFIDLGILCNSLTYRRWQISALHGMPIFISARSFHNILQTPPQLWLTPR